MSCGENFVCNGCKGVYQLRFPINFTYDLTRRIYTHACLEVLPSSQTLGNRFLS